MIHPFVEGAILGLTISVLFGPALFALLQTSIHRGFRSGSLLAIGIFLSDITLVFLCFVGALQILNNEYNKLFFGIVSGFLLIGFGIATYTRKIQIENDANSLEQKKPGWLTFILKGYFMNIANPFAWIFWMGVTVGVTSNYGEKTHDAMLFFGGVLFTIVTTDILKVYIAKKLKRFLKAENISKINKFVGVLLFAFGIIMIVRVLAYHFKWF
jgi:threonine/homoserine/homoserine lactone efflux protein